MRVKRERTRRPRLRITARTLAHVVERNLVTEGIGQVRQRHCRVSPRLSLFPFAFDCVLLMYVERIQGGIGHLSFQDPHIAVL